MEITCLYKHETEIPKRKKGSLTVGIPKCVRLDDEETGLIIISTKELDQASNYRKVLNLMTLYKSMQEEETNQ